jgi:hypothetical protein
MTRYLTHNLVTLAVNLVLFAGTAAVATAAAMKVMP